MILVRPLRRARLDANAPIAYTPTCDGLGLAWPTADRVPTLAETLSPAILAQLQDPAQEPHADDPQTADAVGCAPVTRRDRQHDRDTRRRVGRKDGFSNSCAFSRLLRDYFTAVGEYVSCDDEDEPDCLEATERAQCALSAWIDARVRRARRTAHQRD